MSGPRSSRILESVVQQKLGTGNCSAGSRGWQRGAAAAFVQLAGAAKILTGDAAGVGWISRNAGALEVEPRRMRPALGFGNVLLG